MSHLASQREYFSRLFPGREGIFDLAMAAQVTGKANIFFFGPPGVAKSQMVKIICDLSGGRYFGKLLSKYTRFEDIFGPVSVPALLEGRYEYLTSGFLPDSDIVFLDELTRAEGPILDAIMDAINERRVRLGSSEVPVRTRTFFAAANFLPADRKRFEAVMDRFEIRFQVEQDLPMSQIFEIEWLGLEEDRPEPLGHSFWEKARKEYRSVHITDDVKDAVNVLSDKIRAESIYVSPRRISRGLHVAAALAWLEGRNEVRLLHMMRVFKHVLWNEPSEVEIVASMLKDAIKEGMDALIRSAEAILEEVESCRDSTDFVHRVGRINEEVKNFQDLLVASNLTLQDLHGFVNVQKLQEAISMVEEIKSQLGGAP